MWLYMYIHICMYMYILSQPSMCACERACTWWARPCLTMRTCGNFVRTMLSMPCQPSHDNIWRCSPSTRLCAWRQPCSSGGRTSGEGVVHCVAAGTAVWAATRASAQSSTPLPQCCLCCTVASAFALLQLASRIVTATVCVCCVGSCFSCLFLLPFCYLHRLSCARFLGISRCVHT